MNANMPEIEFEINRLHEFIATQKAEIDTLRARVDQLSDYVRDWRYRAIAGLDEIELLRNWIRVNGHHGVNCLGQLAGRTCSCGLNEIITGGSDGLLRVAHDTKGDS